jgi:carbonic anhydrase/acetyltransferase-like protein (isoleucine patch superfamily)
MQGNAVTEKSGATGHDAVGATSGVAEASGAAAGATGVAEASGVAARATGVAGTTVSIRPYEGVHPALGARVYVDPQACVIGRVTIGDDSSVWPMTVIRGDVNSISIGARTSVQDGAVLHVTHDGPYTPGGLPLVIGDDVTIGHRVMLHACTIGNRCLIGMGAILLDGVVVEDDVIIGAGAVVPPRRRLPARTLWVGNPAKQQRELTDREVENLRYSAAHYVKVKDRYLG